MASDNHQLSEEYRAAALELTIAVSEMVKSLDTPQFSGAFWKVQQANERCNRLRSALDHSTKHERNIYSLAS